MVVHFKPYSTPLSNDFEAEIKYRAICKRSESHGYRSLSQRGSTRILVPKPVYRDNFGVNTSQIQTSTQAACVCHVYVLYVFDARKNGIGNGTSQVKCRFQSQLT